MDRQDSGFLLRRDPDKAFRSGAHLQLGELADGAVTRFLAAEGWQAYLTILYALLLLRRRHELAPLHSDLYDFVRMTIEAIPGHGPYPPESFAADMTQLAAWGCMRKDVEASRIRGYKDRSRENFRYTLRRDALSLLEWLEERLEDRLHGSVQDGRDLLLDLAGRLQELLKLVRKASEAGPDADAARRVVYLLQVVDEGIDLITADLTSLRAEMNGFARGLVAKDDLQKVVGGLEKYASQYVRRMRDLGLVAYKSARRLARPASRAVVDRAHRLMEEERIFRRKSLRDPSEIVGAALPFLAPQGHLTEACSRVEQMASEVVRRIHRQLKDLERRNFRLEEIGARLAQMSALPEADRRPGEFLDALCAFAHFRNDPFPGTDGGKARPPAPRRSGGWAPRMPPAPLKAKRLKVAAIFKADEERMRALREYVRLTLLGGRPSGLLSEAALKTGDDPLGWLAVAKARYLGGGRRLRRAGIMADPRPGSTTLSVDGKHLWTQEHELAVVDSASLAKTHD